MTSKSIIESRISIKPEFFNKNYKVAILKKLKEVTLNYCNNDYGFVLKVNKFLYIKDNFISNVDCEVIFVVVYEAETLKPEINKIFNGKIGLIFHGGIFVKIKEKFEVLIPISKLENFIYDNASKTFVKDERIIKESDDINVKITGLKYCTDKRFKCFGELID